MDCKTIATYVFMDLETTGFPKQELNKTRITELSMVAVKREHILNATIKELPRVVHKFTMCLNPGKMIDPVSTELTGLCNFLLEFESTFNAQVFKAIDSFLSVLKEPICLIAHNGNLFDYPILKNHLVKLNVTFSKNLMCADSFYGLYDIDTDCRPSEPPGVIKVTENNVKDSVFQMQYEVAEERDSGIANASISLKCTEAEQKLMQKMNECTPKSKKRKPQQEHCVPTKVRRRFPWGDRKPEKSYRLEEIYKRVVNMTPPVTHQAEGDCIMLLHISVALNNKFVKWVDINCCPFTEIAPMALGVPIQ